MASRRVFHMEQSFLAYLRGRCRQLPQVDVGIGDDATVLRISQLENAKGELIVEDRKRTTQQRSIVACTDQIIDGVDFLSTEHALCDVGYKAMAINLSDIAAMGASPTAALVTLSLPEANATRIAGDVYEGILEAAHQYSVSIAGGDLSTYNGPLAISITLLGSVPEGEAWLRSGAQEGDAVYVTGPVGGSIRGRHLRPTPRIELAQQLRESVKVHAAIDISDGLSLDLDRLCAASGIGVELDVDEIPVHQDAFSLAKETGRKPFEHAWSDGEDFELLLTMSSADADTISNNDYHDSITRIGTIIGRTGLWRREKQRLIRMSPQGYLH